MTSSIPLKMLEGKFEKGKKNREHVVGQRVSILLPICTVRTQNSLGGLLVLLHCFAAAATDSLPHFLLIFGVCNTENYALFDTLQRSKKFLASLIFLHSITWHVDLYRCNVLRETLVLEIPWWLIHIVDSFSTSFLLPFSFFRDLPLFYLKKVCITNLRMW